MRRGYNVRAMTNLYGIIGWIGALEIARIALQARQGLLAVYPVRGDDLALLLAATARTSYLCGFHDGRARMASDVLPTLLEQSALIDALRGRVAH